MSNGDPVCGSGHGKALCRLQFGTYLSSPSAIPISASRRSRSHDGSARSTKVPRVPRTIGCAAVSHRHTTDALIGLCPPLTGTRSVSATVASSGIRSEAGETPNAAARATRSSTSTRRVSATILRRPSGGIGRPSMPSCSDSAANVHFWSARRRSMLPVRVARPCGFRRQRHTELIRV